MRFPLDGWSLERIERHIVENPEVVFGAGRPNGRKHKGFDLHDKMNAPVKAVKEGKVIAIYPDFYRGLGWIGIKVGPGHEIAYAELIVNPKLRKGDIIREGEIIGYLQEPSPPAYRADGSKYPPMAHIEEFEWDKIKRKWIFINPLPFLRKCFC